MSGSTSLNELQRDALAELINIGVSTAASGLRELVREEILLSVPKIELLNREEAIRLLRQSEASELVGVHQSFQGDVAGRALLIFPEAGAFEIVRSVTGNTLPLDEMMELEPEALMEIGNIVLNACVGTIANMLQRHLHISLPEIIRGDAERVLSLGSSPGEPSDVILFVYIDFKTHSEGIKGYIALLMDMPSLEILRTLLDEFVERSSV